MIGNDVVDLVLAREQSNWQRKGFLQKLFVEKEQRWILESTAPESMVWLLWSMKESAYKVYNRATGLRQFSPLSFICEKPELQLGRYVGSVSCGADSLFTKSVVSEDVIVTESFLGKSIITYYIDDYEGYLNKGVIYKNNSRQPFIEGDVPVSVAHHGRFCVVSVYVESVVNPFCHEREISIV